MRRPWVFGLVVALVAGLVPAGCCRRSCPKPEASDGGAVAITGAASAPAAPPAVEPVREDVPPPAAPPAGAPAINPVPVAPPEPGPQEKYDAALLDALNLLADRKYTDALTALEAARAARDTEAVRLEIEKVKKLLEEQAAAERTVLDIQTVLAEGKAEAAATLAAGGLRAYGDGDTADQLAKLKRQADALAATQLADDAARQDRFRREGDAALQEQNLRAAAIAYEEALACGDDAGLRRKLDDLHATLARYDDNRRRAAELRRDPATLEDAVAALQEAQKAWDTLTVRQEIDDCTLALQNRRDRLAVADFEVRGDVGFADAGRTVAEDLLPAFKGRYDLVEREQLGKVIAELQLQAGDLAGDEGYRREVGKLAKVRYLVLGSVSRVSGLAVSARLVDMRTGLIVQTARVTAATPDDLLAQLPQLATGLLMTDEQKIAYERQQAQQAAVAVVPADPTPLPPPPEPPAVEQPPPAPILACTARPPDPGGVRAADFDRLSAAVATGGSPVAVVGTIDEPPVATRNRLLQVAIELGDNLFRRGCYQEAHRHFELALSLAPERPELRLRVERCWPYLPPEATGGPPVAPAPRLAVLNFAELGDPNSVPPGLGCWTADNLAPWFCPPCEVVDRGEVFWYMARLGMTLRDLMCDPSARLWLARALRVRYFLLGDLRTGDGIIATAHLLDAEGGSEVGNGRVVARDPWELRLRLAELARLTLLTPEERLRYQRAWEADQQVLVQAQLQFDRGAFGVSLGLFENLLKSRPDDVRIQVLVERCRDRNRQAEQEAARRRAWEQQQAQLAELQRRQWELARAADAARLQAQQEAAALTDAERRLRQQQCELAHARLLLQAQAALKQNNFAVSIQFYASALALRPTDDGYRELARARAAAEEAARARDAEAQARRKAELFLQRDAELAQLRARVEQERRRHEAEEQARQRALAQRDQAEYARLLDEGRRLFARAQYDRAAVAFQGARERRRTDEAEQLLSQALVEQARAAAQRQGAAARAELERQLAAAKAERERAEAEARRNRDRYAAALQQAQQALAAQRYDDAVARYHEAEKVYRTDVVLTGLHRAEAARAAVQARAEAEQRQHAEEQKRTAEALLKMTEGEKALAAQEYDRAVEAYRAASRLAPGDVGALAGLSKAEQACADAAARARRQKEEADRLAHFRTLLAGGRANLAARQYDAAVLALTEAMRLNPGDAEVKAALAEAERARGTAKADAAAQAAARAKAEAYQKWLGEGRVALSAKQYDTAIGAFREAQKLLPGDQTAAAFLREAEEGKRQAGAAVGAESRKRDEEQRRAGDLRKALADGRTALAAHNLEAAARSFDAAARLAPQDPEVQRAQQDLARAREAARVENDARQRRVEAYHEQMKAGRDALTARRYDEAARAFAEAGRLMPEDRTAPDLLQQARQLQANAQAHPASTITPAPRPTPPDPEAQRRQRVGALLTAGRLALAAHKLDAADRAFAEAARLAPQDPAVVQAQQDLAQARSAAAAEAEKAQRQAAYQQALQMGRVALAAKRYGEAVKAFGDALKLQPGDAEATRQLRAATRARDAARTPPPPPQRPKTEATPRLQPAPPMTPPAVRLQPPVSPPPVPPRTGTPSANAHPEFARHMAEGNKLLTAKRFAEAAREFEAALKLQPGNAEATAALKRAREGKP